MLRRRAGHLSGIISAQNRESKHDVRKLKTYSKRTEGNEESHHARHMETRRGFRGLKYMLASKYKQQRSLALTCVSLSAITSLRGEV